MIWVVMMFSAAIPVLYLAGVILCFSTYWTDKYLLLRFYQVPHRHGSNLAHRARSIIEWSLVMHLFVGMYMLSNPDIFVGEGDDNKPTGFFQSISEFTTIGIRLLTGVESERFKQAHIIFYAIGTGAFLVLFLIEKITGFFSRCIGRACCCLDRDSTDEIFSNEIFGEIPAEQQ